MAQVRKKKVAVVQCRGGCRETEPIRTGQQKESSEAVVDCLQLAKLDAQACQWGCLGGGSCVAVCRLDAIHINERGAAEVDAAKCVGCGLCAKACPRSLIRITGVEYPVYPACVNEEPGAQARKTCDASCIACGICVKNCPVGAIFLEKNHAVIDEEKCIACGMCAVKCPRGAVRDYNGIFTIREVQVGT